MRPKTIPGKRIAIIGAGISGLSCAKQLLSLGYQVEVFEKSRGPSGRMSTRHGENWVADHGAQYFTARDSLFIKEVDSWIHNEVAVIWEPVIQVYEAGQWRLSQSSEIRYVGRPGMSSPGKFLAQNIDIHYNQTIDTIENINSQWHLSSKESGKLEKSFDWLVLALPAPQAQKLGMRIHLDIEKMTNQAHMKGCWTVMLRFPERPSVKFDAAFINQEIISWIARNHSKPERNGIESWTIHANPQWSEAHIELSKEEATALILDCAKQIGFDCQRAEISTHKWRYASGAIAPAPGFAIYPTQNIAMCGDWLNGGRVEGAWLSGYQLANAISHLE